MVSTKLCFVIAELMMFVTASGAMNGAGDGKTEGIEMHPSNDNTSGSGSASPVPPRSDNQKTSNPCLLSETGCRRTLFSGQAEDVAVEKTYYRKEASYMSDDLPVSRENDENGPGSSPGKSVGKTSLPVRISETASSTLVVADDVGGAVANPSTSRYARAPGCVSIGEVLDRGSGLVDVFGSLREGMTKVKNFLLSRGWSINKVDGPASDLDQKSRSKSFVVCESTMENIEKKFSSSCPTPETHWETSAAASTNSEKI